MQKIHTKLPLILGSGSKSRRFLLHNAGYEFEVLVADIDEKSIRYADPAKLVLALAKAKAEILLDNITCPSLLITCDTVVVCNGKILEKPRDSEEMRYFLSLYQKHPAETFTSLAVTNSETRAQVAGVDVCKIFFNHFSAQDVEDYVSNKVVFSWAGGLGIEDFDMVENYEWGGRFNNDIKFNRYIRELSGDLDSATGLPIRLLKQFLLEIEGD